MFRSAPSPGPLRFRVHPLVSFGSPSESRRLSISLALANSPSRGFAPPSRHQRTESTHDGFLKAAYVPPAAFLALSTGCSSLHLAGLFHPAATSGIALQGFPPAASRSGSSPAHPLLSFPGTCLHTSKLMCSSSCRRASRGLILAAGPWLPTGVLRLPVTRSPLEFSTPRVLLHSPSGRLRDPSAHDLRC